MSSSKPYILLMGQTPPPWHGQAVATQILFEHDWPGLEVERLRMEFSGEMLEVGRFQTKKIHHLWHLIRRARKALRNHPQGILFYPPASANWVPFLRDVVFLLAVRRLAAKTIFIYHASGLPVFCLNHPIRRLLAKWVYHRADVSLEVAQEKLPAHKAFLARNASWCPCGIEVPDFPRSSGPVTGPLRLLFIGSLQEGKGVLEILRTAKVLKDKGRENDFLFQIVGKWFSTEFEEEARRLHAQLALEHMVEFSGQLTGDEKWAAYASNHVFFFPTHYSSEATPLVIMEALGMGMPVLTTEWAGIPAMLEGCPVAYMRPVRSPEAFAEAAVDLYTKRSCLSEWEAAAKRFYQSHFTPAGFIERVERAFILAAEGNQEESIASGGALSPIAHANEKPEITLSENAESCGVSMSPSLDAEANAMPPTIMDRRNSAEDPSFSGACALGEGALPDKARCSSPISNPQSPISLQIYLADQNPGFDRSIGISRMTHSVISALKRTGRVRIHTVSSRSSQGAADESDGNTVLPWDTRSKSARFLTDHLHPLLPKHAREPDVYYYPKGYLTFFCNRCRPSVVTIHDTIIQHDRDHYPDWRSRWEYGYWSWALRHTLRNVDRIITISESSKQQIESFMERHRIPLKKIHVTYEPCAYESIPQPGIQEKGDYVMHLGSREPHKKTAYLIAFWHAAEREGRQLPPLNLVGSYPGEASEALNHASTINRLPFLADSTLQESYRSARALILPSEIEGFGLPALEAYFLGTPVCFVKGTSVEEILSVATRKGGFSLSDPESLYRALDEVLSMSPDEVRECGLKLREVYAAERVAERMLEVFDDVKNLQC